MSIQAACILFLYWAFSCFAAPASLASRLRERQNDDSLTDLSCLGVMAAAAQGQYVFAAYDVYECIGRVPFHPAVATRFLNYYNDTLQYQSTLAFLKDPPEGYQQPPVDVQQELEYIKANISSGTYKSQYEFETQVQLLISRLHDSHITLNAGILSAFRFASPYSLVSVSLDGLQEPQIYIQEDVEKAAQEGYTVHPITKINDISVDDYLTSLVAANSDGYVEQHADWNSLMESPASQIQGYLSLFQRLTLYPGADLNFTLQNDTVVSTIWLALYAGIPSTGPLSTPGDFFNLYVMGLTPAGFNESDPAQYYWWPAEYDLPVSTEEPTNSSEISPDTLPECAGAKVNWCKATYGQVQSYPNDPVVVHNDFSITGAGSVSGYILNDTSTGVLSIPSFYQRGQSVKYFDNALTEFIGNASESNTKRIVIDLQQNSGGLVFLAILTFQRFFPPEKPNTRSRMRSHRSADILGTAYTQWWQSLDPDSFEHKQFAASEWVAVSRINDATGKNFTSWPEFFGPVLDHDDAFSQKQQYNLSDRVFDFGMFGWTYTPWVEPDYEAPEPAWSPENIVLLTDGLCSSACALFVELMTEAGVRTVSVGGRAEQGPMQTASGNRGAAVYSSYDLDYDYEVLKDLIEDKTAYDALPSRDDTGMWTRYASINLRDQMRANDLIPLQFRYEASDCRLYYTPKNVYDMGQLWRDAASATWDNPSLCVRGSTGYSKRAEKNRSSPPARPIEPPIKYVAPTDPLDDPLESSSNGTTGLVDFPIVVRQRWETCGGDYSCGEWLICAPINTYCSSAGDIDLKVNLCVDSCTTIDAPGKCTPLQRVLPQSVKQRPAKKRQVKGVPKPAPNAPIVPSKPPPKPLTPVSNTIAPPPVYKGYIDPGPVQYQKKWDQNPNSPSICGR